MLIVCNGMPRSGSTAIYNLIRLYLEAVGTVKTLGFFSDGDLVARRDALRTAAAAPAANLVKTHYRFERSGLGAESEPRILEVYSVRDLHEIATSMQRVWGFDREKVLSTLTLHTEISQGYQNRSDVLLVKYEEFDDEKVRILKSVSEFLGIAYSETAAAQADATLAEIGQKTKDAKGFGLKRRWAGAVRALNRNLKLGRVLKLFLPTAVVTAMRDKLTFVDRKTMLHPGHVGDKSGAGDDHGLTAEIDARFEAWLAEFGYLTSAGGRSADVV